MTRDNRIEISVIVPFYNEEHFIQRCIDSLLTQRDIDPAAFELVFVDNNSTDASAAIVSKHEQIRLVREQRRQVYTARNTAIEQAQGTILAFTDADCEVSENWLASILGQFRSGTVDILLGEREFSEDASYMSQFMRDYENLKIQFFLNSEDYKRCFGYTNNMAISKRVYDELGGFRDDIPLADTDFILRYIEWSESPRISYSRTTRINHLEIDSWCAWMRKLSLYGKESPKSEIPLYLSMTKQIGLYRYCLNERDYSLFKSALFVLTAVCANAAFLVPYFLSGGAKRMFRDRSA